MEVGKTVIKVNTEFWLCTLLPFLVSQLYIRHINKDHVPFAAVEHFSVSDLSTLCC